MLLVAGAAAYVLTGRSPAFRHALWAGTLLLSVLMPIAVLSLPSIAVLPASWALRETFVTAPGGPARLATSTPDLWSIGWKLWLAGGLLLILRLVVSYLSFIRWQRRCRPLQSLAWTDTLRQLAAESCVPRNLRVIESSTVVNPCTWGFIRPVLLLPVAGEVWSDEERRLAVMHELAHIRRKDFLTATLVRLACAMHWYNPLVWLAARESRKLQEQACDDYVLRSGARPSDYASFLRQAAGAQCGAHRIAAAMAIVRRSELCDRVNAILDPARHRSALSSAPAVGIWMMVACLACFLAAAVPQSPAQSVDSRPSLARLVDEDSYDVDDALDVDAALEDEEALEAEAAFEAEAALEADEALNVRNRLNGRSQLKWKSR